MKRSGALWGTLLIFAGIFLILRSAGLVNVDLWGSLSALWPVFIIAAGITFFLKRDSHIQRLILWLLVFTLIGGYAVYLGRNEPGTAVNDKNFIMKPGIQSAALKVSAAGAKLNIGASETDLADISSNLSGLKLDYDEGSHAAITYSQKMQFKGISSRAFDAKLNHTIPWTFELNTGSLSGSIDFTGFPLNNCTINTGACDLDILAGDKQQDTRIVINGAAVRLRINLPGNTGIRIYSSSAATHINGQVSLLQTDRTYESDGFAAAGHRIYLDVASASCTVEVNR